MKKKEGETTIEAPATLSAVAARAHEFIKLELPVLIIGACIAYQQNKDRCLNFNVTCGRL